MTTPTVTELWTYAGARLTKPAEAMAWLWVDPGGRELIYTRSTIRGSVVGGVYVAEVARGPDGRVTIYGSPAYKERSDRPAEVVAEWEARDAAAKARAAQLARERKDKTRSALDEALAPLEEIAAKLRTGAERDALAATIIRRISRSWR